MGHRRSDVRRPGPRRLSPGSRLSFLLGTAALGAIGFSVLAPSADADAVDAQTANRQAALVLAEAAQEEPAGATDEEAGDHSATAASALAQNQARAQTLAAAAAAPVAPVAVTPAPAPTYPPTADGYKAYAKAKIGAAQFACLDPLWTRESHWRPTADNPSSTAYGIAQLLDSTWRFTGIAKTSDGFRQVDAGLAYLKKAYPGGPCGAWSHEKSVGWY